MIQRRPIALISIQGLLVFILLTFALALAFSGCSRAKPGYTVKPEFSVNVGKTDPAWPKDIKKLSPAEQEMLKMRGRPQLVHVWYVPGVEIVDKMTILRLDPKSPKTLSWIYPSNGEEVIFPDLTHFEIRPISPKIKLICELGDPQEIHQIPDAQGRGRLIEQYRYYNQGRIVTFTDGVQVREDYTEAMPHYLTK